MMPNKEVSRREKNYWAAVNKLNKNEVLGAIEERIIEEMRIDLKRI